jgi:hypothetical protein
MHDLARPRITIHVICMTGGPIFTTKDIVDSDDHEENASAAVRGTHEHVGRGSGSDCESEEDLPVFLAQLMKRVGDFAVVTGRARGRVRQPKAVPFGEMGLVEGVHPGLRLQGLAACCPVLQGMGGWAPHHQPRPQPQQYTPMMISLLPKDGQVRKYLSMGIGLMLS